MTPNSNAGERATGQKGLPSVEALKRHATEHSRLGSAYGYWVVGAANYDEESEAPRVVFVAFHEDNDEPYCCGIPLSEMKAFHRLVWTPIQPSGHPLTPPTPHITPPLTIHPDDYRVPIRVVRDAEGREICRTEHVGFAEWVVEMINGKGPR